METIAKKGPEFNLSDLARAVEVRYGLPRAATINLFLHVAEILPEVIAQHERVELPGIGVISMENRYRKTPEGFMVVENVRKIDFRPADDLRENVEELTGFAL